MEGILDAILFSILPQTRLWAKSYLGTSPGFLNSAPRLDSGPNLFIIFFYGPNLNRCFSWVSLSLPTHLAKLLQARVTYGAYYWAIKRNKLLLRSTLWVKLNLESARSQTKKEYILGVAIYINLRNAKSSLATKKQISDSLEMSALCKYLLHKWVNKMTGRWGGVTDRKGDSSVLFSTCISRKQQ